MNDEPQFQILIDDEKVQALKLSMSDVDKYNVSSPGFDVCK